MKLNKTKTFKKTLVKNRETFRNLLQTQINKFTFVKNK